ncbi:hypothetical protein QBC36DRAFT_314513 [Triangularia setosa]|uniref:Uncharacterized protein n=1 Tax=Triangularia setosa TaxID=2587417 RepID=A0AAN6W0F0_9PEZI|nr:hypothetical protein QBC36DRAFT_314513 [Podospora setosa]
MSSKRSETSRIRGPETDSSTSIAHLSLTITTSFDISDLTVPSVKGVILHACPTPERASIAIEVPEDEEMALSQKSETPNAENRYGVDHLDSRAVWRPFMLQRHIFHALKTFLMLLIVGVETIFIISEKHQGLAAASFSVMVCYA